MPINDFKNWNNWVDHSKNPLIKPKLPEWIIADPSFLSPEDSPDGMWHLFAHGILFGIYHFISKDGIKWVNSNYKLGSGMRPFLFKENETYYLFYEKLTGFQSTIILTKSSDLVNWTNPQTVLKPSLSWEGGFSKNAGNPCLVKFDDTYRLYYSAGSVFLWDCLFSEPKYIGVAEATSIQGPYDKLAHPIISPANDHPYRNFGAGAMKVLKMEDSWIGFNNGIYKDQFGRNRSSILLLHSKDGLAWTDIFQKPIIYPTNGWKRSFVYQLDVRKVGDQYWLYYNARTGWFIGRECIGLSILNPK